MTDLPVRPARLTREQQRAAKQRGKDFDAALKARARAADWRYARGGLFRQVGDWFVDVLPWPLWERGVSVGLAVKPMALDPLFWDIVGLSDNRRLPLSFRASGAWVLRSVRIDEPIALDISDVERLADATLAWATTRSAKMLAGMSIQTMLAQLPRGSDLVGQSRALAVCLYLLADDFGGAMDLCRIDHPAAHPLMQESGGFMATAPDGSTVTFLDQARDWIEAKRPHSFARL